MRRPLILFTAILMLSAMAFLCCGEDVVLDGPKDPYSVSQMKKMMKYHGTLSAVFNGRAWWFKSNGKWVRLDTEDAKR